MRNATWYSVPSVGISLRLESPAHSPSMRKRYKHDTGDCGPTLATHFVVPDNANVFER